MKGDKSCSTSLLCLSVVETDEVNQVEHEKLYLVKRSSQDEFVEFCFLNQVGLSTICLSDILRKKQKDSWNHIAINASTDNKKLRNNPHSM